MNKNILALLLGLSVVGCASNSVIKPTISTSQMSAEDVCCISKKDFAWVELDKVENVGFIIDDSAPVWNFVSGKSFFNAFEFSPRSGKVKLTLSSKMLGKEVFAPTVQLLDKEYNVARTISLDEFNIRFSDMFDANRYIASFEVDAQKMPYMIIYTQASDVGKMITVPHPARVRAEEAGEPRPIVTDPKFVHSYTGELTLELETLSLGSRKVVSDLGANSGVITGAVVATTSVTVQPETKNYYHTAIQKAVSEDNIPKALSLLDEAKALNIEGAQAVFVKAINRKK
ncbi:MalM family protein [Vibrio sp. ZSDZ65]|uniref:MalM family protein n=1 Tax=Vibrio qingdaonensis TaxID=2829491 RepID=A0A9X3CS29_9VIBR|nr:MalM family protein [Vibrio qingdaonensis]MCW8347460.1 MalM family protein [Vibrio qingdaonensis]